MVVKSKPKSKVKKKSKAVVKRKVAVKKIAKKTVKKTVTKTVTRAKSPRKSAKGKAARKPTPKLSVKFKAAVKKLKLPAKPPVIPARRRTGYFEKPVDVTRTINLSNQIRQPSKSALRRTSLSPSTNSNLFNFMKAPRPEYAFEVGDSVEVFCDHEKGRERIRGWLKGIVVQVDNKMVAVQFRSNVFLTDGWMVPDRILWYPLNSEHIRPVSTGKKHAVKKESIPDY